MWFWNFRHYMGASRKNRSTDIARDETCMHAWYAFICISRCSRTRACHDKNDVYADEKSLDMQSENIATKIATRVMLWLYYFLENHVNMNNNDDWSLVYPLGSQRWWRALKRSGKLPTGHSCSDYLILSINLTSIGKLGFPEIESDIPFR